MFTSLFGAYVRVYLSVARWENAQVLLIEVVFMRFNNQLLLGTCLDNRKIPLLLWPLINAQLVHFQKHWNIVSVMRYSSFLLWRQPCYDVSLGRKYGLKRFRWPWEYLYSNVSTVHTVCSDTPKPFKNSTESRFYSWTIVKLRLRSLIGVREKSANW